MARCTQPAGAERGHQQAGDDIGADHLGKASVGERGRDQDGAGDGPEEHQRLAIAQAEDDADDAVDRPASRTPRTRDRPPTIRPWCRPPARWPADRWPRTGSRPGRWPHAPTVSRARMMRRDLASAAIVPVASADMRFPVAMLGRLASFTAPSQVQCSWVETCLLPLRWASLRPREVAAHHQPHVYALRKPAAIASASVRNQRFALARR